ncbi:4-hydroxy-3-methylbut-2-enyl diphosphate reductase [Halosquirtibacter xylanolyticus]|uniref:4-hydroxy-3-methylbut-2-enyl diphosphate reductase n=1 Tax=Halosquirtibacter xylanolyticus TaxID=3374599 RepID=UPI003748ACF0|nr:4-hydroxy-3-methylbut-2-enyl diphosphate reductase [Prolixibacteraceae bacterium]
MIIEIDDNSGFCFGVIKAIKKAEDILELEDELYCLGDIVHNSFEVNRLAQLGLKTVSREEYFTMSDCTVLLRAHGEPPETYLYAEENNIKLIDATCPVVLRLQKKVKDGYDDVTQESGQLVIFGKKGHAEVNGLVGQTNGNAIVIEGTDDIKNIDTSKKTLLFSQTTKSLDGYHALIDNIKGKVGEDKLTFHDTICRQVANRIPKLREFSKRYDIIVFVGGEKSSNAKVLYNICKENNENAYFISHPNQLDLSLFHKNSRVGICGATSTPRHLMDLVAQKLQDNFDS